MSLAAEQAALSCPEHGNLHHTFLLYTFTFERFHTSMRIKCVLRPSMKSVVAFESAIITRAGPSGRRHEAAQSAQGPWAGASGSSLASERMQFKRELSNEVDVQEEITEGDDRVYCIDKSISQSMPHS